MEHLSGLRPTYANVFGIALSTKYIFNVARYYTQQQRNIVFVRDNFSSIYIIIDT